MTVIRPNSVSGITSITAQANEINVFRSNGTLAGLNLNGVNFNTTAGISTLAALKITGNLDVEGVLTYQDVTNVDSVGIVTARSGINVSGTSEFTANVKFDGSTAGRDITFLRSSNTLRFQDNTILSLGDGDDFKAFHNGTDTRLVNIGGGTLKYESDNHEFKDKDNGDVMMKLLHDGAVELYHNNTKRFETTSNGAFVTGSLGVDELYMGDNEQIKIGAEDDFLIYHGGSENVLDGVLHKIELRHGSEKHLVANPDGAVELYHDNVRRLRTYASGVKISTNSSNGRLVFEDTDGNFCWQLAGYDAAAYGTGGGGVFQDATGAVVLDMRGSGTNIHSHNNIKLSANGTADNLSLYLGASDDMRMYHNGTDSYASNGTGKFRIGNTHNNEIKFFTQNSTRWNVGGTGHIYPDLNNAYDIGTSTYRVRNIYTNDLNLSNEGGKNDVDGTWGNYTIQEGESDLFLINKRNGKKYKFNLTEVS